MISSLVLLQQPSAILEQYVDDIRHRIAANWWTGTAQVIVLRHKLSLSDIRPTINIGSFEVSPADSVRLLAVLISADNCLYSNMVRLLVQFAALYVWYLRSVCRSLGRDFKLTVTLVHAFDFSLVGCLLLCSLPIWSPKVAPTTFSWSLLLRLLLRTCRYQLSFNFNTPFTRWSWLDELALLALDERTTSPRRALVVSS